MDDDLVTLKSQWSEVLNYLESQSRIAWLIYFDARLVSLVGQELTVDFSDLRRFNQTQSYPLNADPRHSRAVLDAVRHVTGRTITLRVE